MRIDSSAPIVKAIEQLAASDAISPPESIDLEADRAEAQPVMPGLELEWDLAQHTPACREEVIAAAYATGADDPEGIEQVAAQVLEDRPTICICKSTANR